MLHPSVIRRIRRKLLAWGRSHYKRFPWREPSRSWHGLIAEILLQRTRAKNVVPVYKRFVEAFPEPNDLALAPLKNIRRIIQPLGLRWRAPLLKKLGRELRNCRGRVPGNLNDLVKLPGVGNYAAGAWLGFHGGSRAVIIDANIVRWICRLINEPKTGETRRKKWLINTAEKLTPRRSWKDYNYAVLDFTMNICGVTPKCEQCPIGSQICQYARTQFQGMKQ